MKLAHRSRAERDSKSGRHLRVYRQPHGLASGWTPSSYRSFLWMSVTHQSYRREQGQETCFPHLPCVCRQGWARGPKTSCRDPTDNGFAKPQVIVKGEISDLAFFRYAKGQVRLRSRRDRNGNQARRAPSMPVTPWPLRVGLHQPCRFSRRSSSPSRFVGSVCWWALWEWSSGSWVSSLAIAGS